MKGLVIIPTYNEKDNISPLIKNIFQKYPLLDILIVDDFSPDQTYTIIQDLQDSYKNLYLILKKQKMGLTKAYKSGFNWALEKNLYDFIITMDADFSHDPKELKKFITTYQKNKKDIIIGSRYINGVRVSNWAISRLLLSIGASFFTKLLSGLDILDVTSGYTLYSTAFLKKLPLERIHCKGYIFQVEMKNFAFFNSFSYQEIPITFYERQKGKSKINFSIIIEGFFTTICIPFKRISHYYEII